MIKKFYKEPWRFSFFQAVRLIQNVFGREPAGANKLEPVGSDASPDKELLKFSSQISMGYATSDVVSISDKREGDAPGHAMRVGFMGVAGVNGALPSYYTEFMQQRQRAKDTAMREFYDLFNHRAVSLFYRAWQKHRLPFSYENHQVHGRVNRVDPITNALLALVGRRVTPTDTAATIREAEKLLFYSGVYASSQKSPVALAKLLSDCFEVPVDIDQFVGEWGELYEDDYVVLGDAKGRTGQNNQLGVNAIIGKRVYCVESRIRIIIGPLNRAEFERIKPGSKQLHALCDFAREYVGPNIKFDLRMLLDARATVPARLAGKGAPPSNLGWNTWLQDKDTVAEAGAVTEMNLPSHGL